MVLDFPIDSLEGGYIIFLEVSKDKKVIVHFELLSNLFVL